jgi:hypothetical protein
VERAIEALHKVLHTDLVQNHVAEGKRARAERRKEMDELKAARQAREQAAS